MRQTTTAVLLAVCCGSQLAYATIPGIPCERVTRWGPPGGPFEAINGQDYREDQEAAGNLAGLMWPDGKVRSFVYERSNLPLALTGVRDITTYVYYSDTVCAGADPDAAGHITRYTRYNKHGQVLESVDTDGVLTTRTYDQRQRLLSINVGGRTARYAYDAIGQLKKLTLPDASWVGYDYDDAHRQVAVYDDKGNRTEYVLDNPGNRIAENTRGPGGALKRQLARSIDRWDACNKSPAGNETTHDHEHRCVARLRFDNRIHTQRCARAGANQGDAESLSGHRIHQHALSER